MYGLTVGRVVALMRGSGSRAGVSLFEVVLMLAIAALLAPPVIAMASGARNALLVRQAVESAARLLSEARWTAIREGGAVVEFTADPAWG